jgi:hypothetical protein
VISFFLNTTSLENVICHCLVIQCSIGLAVALLSHEEYLGRVPVAKKPLAFRLHCSTKKLLQTAFAPFTYNSLAFIRVTHPYTADLC